jgi:hypothetical protein
LEYYKTANSKILDKITLTKNTQINEKVDPEKLKTKFKNNLFSINSEGRTLFLYAENNDDYVKWIIVLRTNIYFLNN